MILAVEEVDGVSGCCFFAGVEAGVVVLSLLVALEEVVVGVGVAPHLPMTQPPILVVRPADVWRLRDAESEPASALLPPLAARLDDARLE